MKLDTRHLKELASEAARGMSVDVAERFRSTFNPIIVYKLLKRLELAQDVCKAGLNMGGFLPHFAYCGMMEGDDCTCGVREFVDALEAWEKYNETGY